MVGMAPLRVLKIWHAAVVDLLREKLRALQALPDMETGLLIPPAWKETGQLDHYRPSEADDYPVYVGKVAQRDHHKTYFFRAGLIRALRRFRPHIIDLEEEPFSYVAFQTLLAARLVVPRATLIFNSGHSARTPMHWEFEYIRRRFYRACPEAFARGKRVRSCLRHSGYQGRITLVGNGISLKRFRPPRSRRFLLRGRLRLLFVGRLVEEKGVQDLLQALAPIQRPWRLTLCGDGPFRGELEQQARGLKIQRSVRFQGSVPMDSLPAIYGGHDLLVLPSFHKGEWEEVFGRVLIEAGACGLPAIASRYGGVPEVIPDADLLFPQRDPDELGRLLQSLGWKRSLLQRLGRQAEENAARFSWESLARRYAGVYRRLVRGQEKMT